MLTLRMNRLRTGCTLALRCCAGLLVMTAIWYFVIVMMLRSFPTDNTEILGVQISVGARAPGFSFCGPGQLMTYGSAVAIRAISSCGLVRPAIETHASGQQIVAATKVKAASGEAGHKIAAAYAHWALVRSLWLLGVAVVLIGAFVWWRRSLDKGKEPFAATLRRAGRLGVVLMTALALMWGGSLWSAYAGSQNLKTVRTVDQLFGYNGGLRVSPAPVGPRVAGKNLAVIGDSRVSPWEDPKTPGFKPLDPELVTFDGLVCARGSDSLAALLQQLNGASRVRADNLACPSATIDHGLLDAQPRSYQAPGSATPETVMIEPQVGLLKQLTDLQQVVVVIGPNDVHWSFLMGTCLVIGCGNPAADSSVSSELANFQTSYNDLLAELAALPTHPAVVIVGSYGLYDPGAAGTTCADLKSSVGSHDINAYDIEQIEKSRTELNGLLEAGAKRKGFAYVEPQLAPLCAPDPTGVGAQIVGTSSPYRFHPTRLGELVLAGQVNTALDHARLSLPPALVGSGR